MNKKQRNELLDELAKIHQQYSQEPSFEILSKVQNEQINLVEKILNILRDENKNELLWEKARLLSAIGYIRINRLKNTPSNDIIPSFIWQIIPLVEIELSLTPEKRRSQQGIHNLKPYESITIDSLLSFCREIKAIT